MRRRRFGSLLGAAALAPLASLPVRADANGTCAAGSNTGDDRQIDRAALCRMADRLAAPTVNVHSVLVAHRGRLVFERYFNGPDEVHSRRVRDVTFDAATLHDMKSVSKSVASLALGIAMDRGLIPSVDTPILNFFPELADMRSPDNDRLTLAHALTMSLGRKWVEADASTGDYANDEARMNMSPDSSRYVLGLPVTAPPGREFFYNTGALTLVSTIVRKATGRPLDDFAREVLFEPLGITAWDWKRRKGDTDAGGGLRLRPRDMIKIGQLVLDGGNWNGRQIVSKAWIDASTTPHLVASDKYAYGYLWWLGRTPRTIAALGRGGQSIRIVPELDLVVAVTAGYYQDYSPQAFRLQANIFRDVLSAVSAPG